MSSRKHAEKAQRTRRAAEEESPEPQKSIAPAALKADMDAILDEIDSVLEENAEEFVESYIQKGGE